MLCFFIIIRLLMDVDAGLIKRRTKFGEVIGLIYTSPSGNTVEKYLGLPYARAPVGQFRFEYPIPLHSFPAVPYNATFRRPWCLQDDMYVYRSIGNEDCLYLNIFTPHETTNNSRYPVLFWIHGGSYKSWSGNVFDVDGAIDNFVSKGIILVTINFRLGALGFMSLLNSKLPGNYGLEDQLLALKWVNKYIDDFGGDKDSITICGESSGAASANLLAFSPKSTGFFHKIIMISGAAPAPWAIAPEVTKYFTKQIIDHVRCQGEDELECLKFQPYFRMSFGGTMALSKDASHNTADPFSEENRYGIQLMIQMTPVVDNYRGSDAIVPFPLWQLITMSKLQVPVLMGFSRGELPRPVFHRAKKFSYLLPLGRLNNRREAVEIIKKHYCGNSSDETCFQLERQIYNDYIMNVPVCMMAKLFEKCRAPTYVYCYDLKNDRSDEPAEHLSDVAFLFNNPSLIINNVNPPDIPLPAPQIKSFIFDSFLNFIKTGDPNNNQSISSLGFWPKYKPGESSVVRIQNDIIKLEGCYENEGEFWQSLDVEYAKYSAIKFRILQEK